MEDNEFITLDHLDNENSTLHLPKQKNIILRFFKAVFVKNIGYKLLAIGLSVALWALAAGLMGV